MMKPEKTVLHIDILSLFPEMFTTVFNTSILGRATTNGQVSIDVHNFRTFAQNKHHKVDDYPYGGGAGLVLMVQPLHDAIKYCLEQYTLKTQPSKVIMLTPQGKPFTHKIAQSLAKADHLIFLCGHYEGFDERIREHLVTDELSLGDFVMTGGEIAAMAMIDATVRLLPGVIEVQSHEDDSFSRGLLEYPHYTRPSEFNGWKVPDVLLSGNHQNIADWREQKQLERTKTRRPDLLQSKGEQDE